MHTPLHFGLKEDQADSAKIIWPDGKTERLFTLKVDQLITIHYADAKEVTIQSQKKSSLKQRVNGQVFVIKKILPTAGYHTALARLLSIINL